MVEQDKPFFRNIDYTETSKTVNNALQKDAVKRTNMNFYRAPFAYIRFVVYESVETYRSEQKRDKIKKWIEEREFRSATAIRANREREERPRTVMVGG